MDSRALFPRPNGPIATGADVIYKNLVQSTRGKSNFTSSIPLGFHGISKPKGKTDNGTVVVGLKKRVGEYDDIDPEPFNWGSGTDSSSDSGASDDGTGSDGGENRGADYDGLPSDEELDEIMFELDDVNDVDDSRPSVPTTTDDGKGFISDKDEGPDYSKRIKKAIAKSEGPKSKAEIWRSGAAALMMISTKWENGKTPRPPQDPVISEKNNYEFNPKPDVVEYKTHAKCWTLLKLVTKKERASDYKVVEVQNVKPSKERNPYRGSISSIAVSKRDNNVLIIDVDKTIDANLLKPRMELYVSDQIYASILDGLNGDHDRLADIATVGQSLVVHPEGKMVYEGVLKAWRQLTGIPKEDVLRFRKYTTSEAERNIFRILMGTRNLKLDVRMLQTYTAQFGGKETVEILVLNTGGVLLYLSVLEDGRARWKDQNSSLRPRARL